MSASVENVKVVELAIAKLELKTGDLVAVVCPENWRAIDIAQYAQHFYEYSKSQDFKARFLFFPYGTELSVIS